MVDYAPTTWEDEPSTATPVSAANLQKMEGGIDTAHAELHAHEALTDAHGATAAATGSTIARRDAAGKIQGATPTTGDPATTLATMAYVDTAVAGRVVAVGGGTIRLHPASTTLPATALEGDLFVRERTP